MPLSSTQLAARYVSIRAGSANASDVRFGGGAVSSSSGGFLAKGEAFNFPYATELSNAYDLSAIFVLVAVGDTITVTYGV